MRPKRGKPATGGGKRARPSQAGAAKVGVKRAARAAPAPDRAGSAGTARRPSRRSDARGGPAPDHEQDYFSLSEKETFEYGEALGRSLIGGELIVLCGELGTGKTVFARGIASALGIDPHDVGSPTFILVDRHIGRMTLYHADLYRLDREEQVLDLGLDEFAALGAVVVVEWGEKLPQPLREGAIRIDILDLGDDTRKIRLTAADREG